MIGFSLDDGACPVDLLGEYGSDHLVGEGELRERQLFVGSLVDGFGKAVGTAYDKYQSPASGLPLLQPLGELDAAIFVPVLVEQDKGVGRGNVL